MNRSELIAEISNTAGVTKAEIGRVLDALADAAIASMSAGQDLTIPGIGKLKVGHRAGRMGRNPKTGEAIEIAARNTVGFTPAKALKDAVL